MKKDNRDTRVVTMDMFSSCIPWEQAEMILGKKRYKELIKWMFGQTVPIGGIYSWDLERFLAGYPVID